MGRLRTYDLICYGAMACVAVGVVLNVIFLQAVDGRIRLLADEGGPGALELDARSRLVLIPVWAGLATPAAVYALRRLLGARRTLFLEAVGAGAIVYLLGSSLLSLFLPAILQPRPAV